MSGNPHIDVRVKPWLDSDAERRGHGLDQFDPEELQGGRRTGVLALLIFIAMFVGLAVWILTAH